MRMAEVLSSMELRDCDEACQDRQRILPKDKFKGPDLSLALANMISLIAFHSVSEGFSPD